VKIELILHHASTDTECDGDYIDVEIKLDGETVQEYGDSYHDDGRERAEGWIDGFRYAYEHALHNATGTSLGRLVVTDDLVADRDSW